MQPLNSSAWKNVRIESQPNRGCLAVMKRNRNEDVESATPVLPDDNYVHFIANDDHRPIRAHKNELSRDNLLYHLAMHQTSSEPIPLSCSRDVLRSVVTTLRTGEVILLGDTNMDEYLETMSATSIMPNPYNRVFELDSNSLTQFLASNGFNTTVTAEVNSQTIQRHLSRTRTLWHHLAHSIGNWPSLRRAMRECKSQHSPVSMHIAPSAARIHINTAISDQGKQTILRCLCERIATQRTSIASQSEQDLLELFVDEKFTNDFFQNILQSPCGPFWFIQHDCADRRKLGIDKVIKRLMMRIINEPTTDLDEPTKISTAIVRIRKLWDALYAAVPRIEAYFGMCESEPTEDIRMLHDVFGEYGMKLVSFKRARRTMDTSQILTFPLPDVQLDSIDAALEIHFFQQTRQHERPPAICTSDSSCPEGMRLM